MIPFHEQIHKLYRLHIKELSLHSLNTVLDIGCGNGNFALLLQNDGYKVVGIDLSENMVKNAKSKGVDARAIDIENIYDEKFDCATAVFDVLNYITPDNLQSFFGSIWKLLNENGILIVDVNTIHGFSDIADGDARFTRGGEELFVSAHFADGKLTSDFILFEPVGELYKKSCSSITQYYHDKKTLSSIDGFRLEKMVKIKLFSDRPDKEILVYRRISTY